MRLYGSYTQRYVGNYVACYTEVTTKCDYCGGTGRTDYVSKKYKISIRDVVRLFGFKKEITCPECGGHGEFTDFF